MTRLEHFFQLLATSSRTFSASPSSLHPDPQCRPMKVANACRAEEVRVRLCFFVNVLNASGRRVAGGRRIGNTVGFAAGLSAGGARMGAVLRGWMGWTGVPNAGDDEGIGLSGTIEGFSGRLVVAMIRFFEVQIDVYVSFVMLKSKGAIKWESRRTRAAVARGHRPPIYRFPSSRRKPPS